MDTARHKELTGNRCWHDPQNPRLSPPVPIRRGPGGLPRLLSLAAEKAKEWYFAPGKCPPLQTSLTRQTRGERREARQVVLEFLLSRLDLATLCLGVPTLKNGFIDLDMKTIVAGTGLAQRRCERAISQMKAAGFMEVRQPRFKATEGKYLGLRAIRVITARFFEWLGLGAMLARERARASKALKAKIAKFGLNLSDVVRRTIRQIVQPVQERGQAASQDLKRLWNGKFAQAIRNGTDFKEAQRQVNTELGYPPDWSPGRYLP
jgi:hypothetical protein